LRKSLFEFLQLAFKGGEPFRSDAKRLKEAISQGACTLSEMSSSTALVAAKSTDFART
jgi:hypothetical protein